MAPAEQLRYAMEKLSETLNAVEAEPQAEDEATPPEQKDEPSAEYKAQER